MGSLVKDLKDLEDSSIKMPEGTVCKGTLCTIAGDNLGSHNIGGFVENFSRSLHFCRYRETDRKSFESDLLSKGITQTAQSYKDHARGNGGDTAVSGAVKFDSLFNNLNYFHVCRRGLPSCLGHDRFEGIVSSDLALFIKHQIASLRVLIDEFVFQTTHVS